MMPTRLATLLLLAGCAAPIGAGEMKEHRDLGANPKYSFDNFFNTYGPPSGVQGISYEPTGLRFVLESSSRDAKQTGFYSKFTLTGDFEISANYEWLTQAEPKKGYGVSCGFVVEAERKTVQLARGFQIGTGDAFLVTTGMPTKKGIDYKTEPTPTRATKGKLVMRRVKNKVTCLASDGTGELEEIGDKTIFTTASVREVRFFADPGDAPNAVEAKLTDIQVRAEAINSDIPLRERESHLVWWLTIGFSIFAVIGGYLGYRRWQDDKWLWSRGRV